MKIAFTGAHGTGKTVSTFEECKWQKIKTGKEVGIVREIARGCPFPLNKDVIRESQLWIFSTQLSKEIELSAIYDIIVCDRSLVDAVAYSYTIGDQDLINSMINLAEQYINSYDKIFFKTIENNNYLVEDGTRDIDKNFQKDIENKLWHLYKILGVEDKLIYL